MSNNAPWPDERIERLRKLFAEGLSAGAIAAELGGGVTRNAVISKLGRLGLKLSPKANTGRPAGAPRKLRKSQRHPFKPWKPSIIEQIPAVEATDLTPEPVANPVTLMQLEGHHCRWPVDMPNAPMMYCGAGRLDGHSYCRGHCDMAYSHVVKLTRAELEVRARHMAKMRKARAA